MVETRYTLKQWRTIRGFSQDDVAQKVKISREHLSRIEGENAILRKARVQTIIDLANLYGIHLSEIDFS